MDDSIESISCTALRVYHGDIIQDIQGDVTEALFDEQVLTESEYEKIKSLVSVANKICILPLPLNAFDFISVICVLNIFKMTN